MEKSEKYWLISVSIGFILCIVSFIYISKLSKRQHAVSVQTAMKMVMEAGYAQGQMDAIKGTIRIHPVTDSSCVWLSSPWGKVKPMNDTIYVNINYR